NKADMFNTDLRIIQRKKNNAVMDENTLHKKSREISTSQQLYRKPGEVYVAAILRRETGKENNLNEQVNCGFGFKFL
ncbi:hypothetical protein XENOCAPTIV_002891, partial [Xenoophorus captivus]